MPSLTAARGLQTQKNALTVPDGALSVADNIIIDFDNTIQKRRGFKDYSSVALAAKPTQIFTYRSKLMVHYDEILAFDSNSAGVFTNFSGTYSEAVAGLRMKSVEANGNLYFTSSTGVKKISSATAAGINTNSITISGGVKAIDLSGTVTSEAAGFLPAQSKVAYRLVFGTKDANSNLIIGSPSSRVILTNASKDVSQSEIFTINVLNFAAITTGDYLLFDMVDGGYFIYFDKTGTTPAPVNADTLDRQEIKITATGAPTPAEVAANIANRLSATVTGVTIELTGTEVEVTITAPGDVTNASQGSLAAGNILVTKIFDGSITTGTTASATLTSILPSAITSDYFYQLYRTATQTISAGVTINDLEPGDEQYFIFEAPITAADIAAGIISIYDNTPDIFREAGAYLYTNATTGTGIVSANERPPVSTDIAVFRNSLFFANTKDVHRLPFNMLSVDDFVSGVTKFTIGKAASATEYTFVGVAEVVDYTVIEKNLIVGSSYIETFSANDERKYYFWFDKGTLTKSFDATTAVAANVITLPLHGLATNDRITFTGSVPGGLVVGTPYFAIRTDANNISVKASVAGSAITLSDTVGTAVCTHVSADPAITAKIGVRIPLGLFDSSIAETKLALIAAFDSTGDFTSVDFSASVVRISCADNGNASTPISSSPASGITFSVVTNGEGEDKALNKVLLSNNSSVAIAIDLTARSLLRVINSNSASPVFGQYLTGADDLPGKILLEAKSGEDVDFYIAISTAALASEFSPELSVKKTISGITIAGNLFTTTAAHGLIANDVVYVHDRPGNTPIAFSGKYTIATAPTATTFTLVGVTVLANQAAITGTIFKTTSSSDNNEGPNRLYYSKVLQPEAVPISNYVDVGSKDKPILRILPLRDNLFVLKEDGIYIITGDVAPNFTVRLLDNSAILIAPDTAQVLNNLIYALTTQGVVSISETGVSIIARDIEDLIKKVTTFNYNFKYTSFGVAYESDRSYMLFLPTSRTDNVATQCFRFNTITNTWTRWILTSTCGLVKQDDDRLYLGGGERFFISQERKEGSREDYADRDFTRTIGTDGISGTNIFVNSAVDIVSGDVLVQEQYLTTTKFNRFLKKLDTDSGPADNDYYSTLLVGTGANLSTKLTELIVKLNADANLASFTTSSGLLTKEALQTDFNLLIDQINGPSSGTAFKNYKKVVDLIRYEVLIEKVSNSTNTLTVNFMPYILQGSVTIFKAFECEVQWAPQHFGKPEVLKQIHEGTLLFEVGTIYGATIAYSSDSSAAFEEIAFTMQGPGFWACYEWANTVWGGGGNSIPLRTLIPYQKSRCRFLNVRFKHKNAREAFKLLGISLEVREFSTRGYR